MKFHINIPYSNFFENSGFDNMLLKDFYINWLFTIITFNKSFTRFLLRFVLLKIIMLNYNSSVVETVECRTDCKNARKFGISCRPDLSLLYYHWMHSLHFLLLGISGSLLRLRSVPPLPGRFDGTCSGVGQELKLEHESPTSLTTLSRPPLPVEPPPPGPGPPPPTDRPLLLSPPNKLM